MALSKKHANELRSSGISLEAAEALGIRTEYDPRVICQMLNRSEVPDDFTPALVFPFVAGYSRIKPANPEQRDGKPVKYLSPTGVSQHAYFPFDRLMREDVRTLGVPIFITEGEKKSIKATLDGFPCIGLTGVYGWKVKQKDDLLPELKNFHWWDRRVYIVFDSDAITNRHVLEAEKRLAAVLASMGAHVSVVRLPQEEDEKVGLDDYLVTCGAVDFEKLVRKAKKIDSREEDQPLPVVTMNEVDAEKVEWLWPQRVPFASLTMFSGDPGTGKSQIICDIVARLSNALTMPPRKRKIEGQLPSRSLIIASEDHAAKVIKPRLIACGADLRYVDVVSDSIVSFPEKLYQFRKLVLDRGYEFVAFDPITSCIHEKFGTTLKASVRGVLFELSKIAEESGAAFVMLRHYSKSSANSPNALYRGMGSINWSAAVRAEIVVEGPIDGVYYFGTLKASYSARGKTIAYRIAESKTHDTSRISWLGYDDRTTEQVVQEAKCIKTKRRRAVSDDMVDYLNEVGGSCQLSDLHSKIVGELGHPQTSFDRARKLPMFKQERNPLTNKWEVTLRGRRFPWKAPGPKRPKGSP